MDKSIIGIFFALGISFFILYSRKAKWMTPKKVWFFCLGFLIVGIFGLLLKNELRNERLMYFGFCVPLVYWIFDRLFKKLSEKIHNRDFILFLRNSSEIDYGFSAENPHVKTSDKLFSFGLLIIIIGTLFIGMKTL
ncbi:hypothetical protein H0I29_14660 [Polaribacter sp. R2A056_3_33]|uniref:hypothetical protein n=1 Tax=Polaribacter sp. R2A056_3_33 TaxID=2745563 RepID=UPI001C4E8237|nr:hypothetical protein [Polaribacter sp. R2A056_3_33]QXP69849.1 hypothetical protein H0I29_14660 [Polaribacter sp. R2A056_3_33]